MILPQLLSVLTDVISIDPDLIVVYESEIGLIASSTVSGVISAVFIQGSPKRLCICSTTLDAWSPTETPLNANSKHEHDNQLQSTVNNDSDKVSDVI